MMCSKARLVLVAASVLVLSGCNGDSPTNGTTTSSAPATTSIPPMAEISVEVLDFGALVSGQGNLFFVSVRLEESGGVGANINFARLEVFRATGELEERQEVGAGQIIAGVGDNRLESNTTEEATITFLFRATVKRGRQLRLTMGFTDDFGNDHESVEDFFFG